MNAIFRAALAVAVFTFSQTASAVLISEFQPNPAGADPADVSIELMGTAGASFTGILLSIESDGSTAAGTIDRMSSVSGTFDSNGLLVVSVPDLENPSFTLVLLDSFTGSIGTSIDADQDGIADDLSTFGTVLDAIGIPDNAADESFIYGAQLGGLDFSYSGDEPKLVFRDGVTMDWYAINDPAGTDAFDLFGNAVAFGDFNVDPSLTTFGAINPTTAPVPVPAALWLLASALGVLGVRGRRNA